MSAFSHNPKAHIITNESIDTIPNLRALLNQILADLDGKADILTADKTVNIPSEQERIGALEDVVNLIIAGEL